MAAKFINPISNQSGARVFATNTTSQSSLEIVDCDSTYSRSLDTDEITCFSCPSNVENTCTAKPGDTCFWGEHVKYESLSIQQRNSLNRSVYLKQIPKPE